MARGTGRPTSVGRHRPLGADTLVKWERRKLYWFVGLALLFGPGLALVVTVFGGKYADMGWMLGVCFGAIFVVFVLAQWYQIHRVLRRLSAFCGGEHLAHWTYTPDEWRAFAEARGLVGHGAGEAFVGHRGGYCGGQFVEWQVLGAALEKVVTHELPDGTPVRLEFVIHMSGPLMEQDWRTSFWVPIPSGKGAEARELLRRLRR